MIRLDKIKATAHLVSFKFANDLQNGAVVALGALDADGETYTATAPADVTADYMVLHASVPLNYDERLGEKDFVLKAGKEGRGYVPERGDVVTITDDQITGTTVVGEVVIPANGTTQLKAAATINSTTPEALVFKVIEKTTLGGSPATAVEVIKA